MVVYEVSARYVKNEPSKSNNQSKKSSTDFDINSAKKSSIDFKKKKRKQMKLNFEQKKELYEIQFKPLLIFRDVFKLLNFKLRDGVESEGYGDIFLLKSEDCFHIVLKMVKNDIKGFKKVFDAVIDVKVQEVIDNPTLIGLKEAIDNSLKFVNFVYKMNESDKSDKSDKKRCQKKDDKENKKDKKKQKEWKEIKLNFEQKLKLYKIQLEPYVIFGDVFELLEIKLIEITCGDHRDLHVMEPEDLLYVVLKIMRVRNEDFMIAFDTVIRVVKKEVLNNPKYEGLEQGIWKSIKFLKFVDEIAKFNGMDFRIVDSLAKLEQEKKCVSKSQCEKQKSEKKAITIHEQDVKDIKMMKSHLNKMVNIMNALIIILNRHDADKKSPIKMQIALIDKPFGEMLNNLLTINKFMRVTFEHKGDMLKKMRNMSDVDKKRQYFKEIYEDFKMMSEEDQRKILTKLNLQPLMKLKK